MATITATETRPKQRKGLPKNVKLPPENERYMRCCSDIASALVQDYESQSDTSAPKRDLNLNALRGQMSKKHFLSTQPPLTAIIAAVPEHYKKYILPKLIAKPIRGLALQSSLRQQLTATRVCIWYCCCRCYVQAAPMSSYRLHGQHLRLLSWWPRFRFRILNTIIHRL
jgi:hypothetical protein